MSSQQLLITCLRRFDVVQEITQSTGDKSIFNGGQAPGTFGVIGPGIVILTCTVTQEGCTQNGFPVLMDVIPPV